MANPEGGAAGISPPPPPPHPVQGHKNKQNDYASFEALDCKIFRERMPPDPLEYTCISDSCGVYKLLQKSAPPPPPRLSNPGSATDH